MCFGSFLLLNVGVIIDVVLAVAEVALAAGAIPELQLRIGYISPAADCAAVDVRGMLLHGGTVELDRLFLDRLLLLFPEQTAQLDPPGEGDDVGNIFSKEQEIVRDRHKGEQAVGEQTGGSEKGNAVDRQRQIDQRKDPGLDRNDIQQQEPGIGIHSGKAQKQAHIQIGDICPAAKEHRIDIH